MNDQKLQSSQVIAGLPEERVEDGGRAVILRVDPPDETGLFFRLQSWDETQRHEAIAPFRGKEIAGLFTVGEAKVHVLQMEHWWYAGATLRAFTTLEAAEVAAIALFNDTLLEDLNWRLADNGLKTRKPVTKLADIGRLMAWANAEYDWSALCVITTVDLEGSATSAADPEADIVLTDHDDADGNHLKITVSADVAHRLGLGERS